jgi:hypothetical protein
MHDYNAFERCRNAAEKCSFAVASRFNPLVLGTACLSSLRGACVLAAAAAATADTTILGEKNTLGLLKSRGAGVRKATAGQRSLLIFAG